MGNEELSTIPEKESDKFIKSSVEDLIPILRESEDTSGSDSKSVLPSSNDFSPIFEEKSMTFFNPLFDSNDFTSSDNELLSDEDVPEDVKIYSNPLFEFNEEYISSDVNPLFDKVLENIESKDSYVSNLDETALLVTPLSDANEDECFDLGGVIDEIDAFLDMDISTDIENGYHNSEGDIIYLESLLIDDTSPNLPPKVFLDHDPDEPDNDDLMTEDKVFDPGIHEKSFSLTFVKDLLIIPPVLHAANGAGGGRDHLPQGRGFSQVPDIPGLGGVVPTFQNSCPFRGPSDDAKQASRQIFACHPKHESEWGVSDDALRLHLLPVTPGKIVPFRMVLIVCKEYSINSLDQLEKYFSETYSTPFMRDKLRNDSTNVRQRTRNESLFEAGNVIRRLVVVLISMYNDCPATVAKIERIGCSGSLQSMVVNFIKNDYASSSGTGSLPSNTVANPKGELKAITTRSGLVLDEPTVPMPPPFINLEEDERIEETLTDPEHGEFTIKVPPPLVQKAKQRNFVIHQRDPRHLNILYPSRMNQEKQKENDDVQIYKFWQMFKQLHINITLSNALILIPKYQKMLKSLLSNKEKLIELANTPVSENCSAVILKKLPEKLGDPGKFLIPCGFSELKCKALADLGASINLMPLSVWKELGLPELISTQMTLELANRDICTPKGIARDVFVPVGKFTFPADFVIVDYESDPRVPLILGRPFLRTARALIDVHGEEMILRDGNERLILNMRNDTSSYSNEPHQESINMIDVYNVSYEEIREDLFATKHPSGNPTSSLSSHTNLTSPEVNDDIFDPEEDIIENLLNLDKNKDLPPYHDNQSSGNPTLISKPETKSSSFSPTLISLEESELIWEEFKAYLASDSFPPGNCNPSSLPPHFHNSLSGSSTSSSPSLHIYETSDYFLEEFADELAHITFPPGNDDLPFDAESDLLELEYLLNHDPIKDMDSILEDSVDENSLDDNLDDTISEMFTDEHALDYSSPPLWDDYDDDLFDHESDNDNVYDDPFDFKEEKIKDSKILIDELDPSRSSDFLPFPKCDSVFYEDFSEVDALPSTNNEDKVFNPGILIHENLFEATNFATPDKNVKKTTNASLILEDFNPPLYELPFHKEAPGLGALLSFSSKNEEKVFNPGILTSKRVHTSLLPELSHLSTAAFKVTKILESPIVSSEKPDVDSWRQHSKFGCSSSPLLSPLTNSSMGD
ncbi:reverse transcriptase domain-containing protein [Tanacetum coccineum]